MTSKYEEEFLAQKDDLHALLEVTTNPLHRKILKNYRRHSLLEISGRLDECIAPDMIVEHPVYKFFEGGEAMILDGMEAVRGFYDALKSTSSMVQWTGKSKIAVADWGFAGEIQFNQFVPGSLLREGGFADMAEAAAAAESDAAPAARTATEGSEQYDHDAVYLVRRKFAYVWPYASDGRLAGEQLYEDTSERTIIKVEPEDVITLERARELLEPMLETHWP
ncbi:hypothetical protein GCM10010472_65810 [Pseudonocardia halophobica]|uniref:Uncharacterized protein n=1 Tax=Pseudonocardia halophobica TaxID=29401 RepID=A0A9W6L6L2_9PSEU|nr:hypothetical protein [Pseudonocardia halophobica]GLL14032.1 hypothetical protein GCM10017577_51770 [Pseudonocardia halophobica]